MKISPFIVSAIVASFVSTVTAQEACTGFDNYGEKVDYFKNVIRQVNTLRTVYQVPPYQENKRHIESISSVEATNKTGRRLILSTRVLSTTSTVPDHNGKYTHETNFDGDIFIFTLHIRDELVKFLLLDYRLDWNQEAFFVGNEHQDNAPCEFTFELPDDDGKSNDVMIINLIDQHSFTITYNTVIENGKPFATDTYEFTKQ